MTHSFDSPVLFYRAADAAEAAYLGAALDSAGIRSHRSGGEGSISFGELGADVLRVDLWVEEDKLVAAKAVIEKLQAMRATDAGKELPEWRCTECDEVSEGSFDVCWKCGAARASG